MAGERRSVQRIELSLADAIRHALAANLEIRIARVDEDISRRAYVVERAVFDPIFNLGATYSKNRRPTVSFLDIGQGALAPEVQTNPFEVTALSSGFSGQTILGTTYSLSLEENGFNRPRSGSIFALNPEWRTDASIQLTQPLLKRGWYAYNSANIRLASNNRELSLEDLEITAMDVIFRVEEAYWQLAFAQKNYQAKEKALRVAEENYQNARAKERVGTLAAIDVTTVQSQLALRKVEFNEARLLLENSRDALLDLVNFSGREAGNPWRPGEPTQSYEGIEVVPTSEPDLAPIASPREEALGLAYTLRPEYRRLALQLENQDIQVALAENELWPSVDLTAGWTHHGLAGKIPDSFESLESGQFYSWSIGVQLAIPIFQRGPRNVLLRARDNLRKLRLQRASLENQILLEVDQSLRELQSLHERVQDLEERVRLQEAILEAERRKLEVGKSISYTVSTIENDLVDSQAQSLRVKADYQTAKARYYRATGQLLERHGVTVEE